MRSKRGEANFSPPPPLHTHLLFGVTVSPPNRFYPPLTALQRPCAGQNLPPNRFFQPPVTVFAPALCIPPPATHPGPCGARSSAPPPFCHRVPLCDANH